MKQNLLTTIAAAAIMASALPSCKTTEENYRTAYEITKAKKNEGLTGEEISGFAREEAIPRTVYKGDSISLKAEYLTRVEGGTPGNQRGERFNVVVASFKQLFNARSVLTRLKEGGFDDAILLKDRHDRYFVGAVTTPSLDSALTVMRGLEDKSPVPLRDPYPYILRNAFIPD